MLTVLIIGSGSIAGAHAGAFLSLGERAGIRAVVDSDKNRAEEFIKKHKLSARVYTDYREALAKERIDLASICTPPPFHKTMTVDCLNAGAHVLLEKPMAPSLEECDAMLAAAEKNKRLLSVVAQNRYYTPTRNIKRLLEDGHCGKLLYTQAISAWWRGRAYYETWHGTLKGEGGGCTLNLAVHQIDLLIWMAGLPCELMAMMSNVNHSNAEVEDISMAMARFPDGSLGEITGSTIHHGEGQTMVFQTERAGLGIPFFLHCSGGPSGQENESAAKLEALYKGYPPLKREGHAGQIEDFVTAIETGKGSPILPTGRSGREAIEVVTGIYKAALSGRTAALPISADDPFYNMEERLKVMPRF
ncbi:oxidoreductase [Spirochaetia bacterium]|nr:oxidoreductase [Spirochaetia bacterium]